MSVLGGTSKPTKKKNTASGPPAWFTKFSAEHEKQQQEWRTELRDFMHHQEQLQTQRLAVCKDMVNLMKQFVGRNES